MRPRSKGGGLIPTDVGTVTVLKNTGSALLVRASDDDSLGGSLESFWIGNTGICTSSEISDSSEEGEEGNLIVPRWLAEQNGWWNPK